MGTIIVKTGFGYYRDKGGKAFCKATLPPGEHPLSDDFIYVEVANQAELDAITVELPAKSIEQIQAELIEKKTRELAINALKAEGKW